MNILPRYSYTKRQIKKVKGWEIHFTKDDKWPVSLGFYPTLREAKEIVKKHREQNEI